MKTNKHGFILNIVCIITFVSILLYRDYNLFFCFHTHFTTPQTQHKLNCNNNRHNKLKKKSRNPSSTDKMPPLLGRMS